jgi:tRNA 2-thiouridine synthesizing protein E
MAARGIEHAGRLVPLDEDGHLLDPGDWSRSLAVEMARLEGLVLTESHWWVIDFVRDHHARYGNPPLMRVLIGEFRHWRQDPALSSRELYRLFSENPVRQACRLGGYPKPEWCI